MNWSGRVAVVTGGASGIGAATVAEFAGLGVQVALLDINADAGQRLAAEHTQAGHTVRPFTVDVADRAACAAAVAEVMAAWGRVDFLVNNAVSFIAKGLDATPADWERSLGVNVQGYANMVTVCHEPIRRTGGGAIVNLASISGHIAQPNRWTYNASKGAIIAMTKCQALDLAADRIRVNAVSPGWIWTPEVAKAAQGDRAKWEPVWGGYHMLRRLGEAQEVARAIRFLCSDDASFITAAELPVDGGYLGLGSEGLGESSAFAGSE
jgi:NAD(P)-dependent dehydrogenase (short-subunit alcohol dehydrogenase family)